MDFELNEQQNMLKTMARDFLSVECNKVKVRDLEKNEINYDPEMWSKMAELGWLGLIFPEQYGGTGADLLDLVILMEEMGRNITPGPFFSTVALCAIPLMRLGNKRQKENYLTSIAEGKSIWSLAVTEQRSGYETSHMNCSADYDGKYFVINGEKMFVPYARVADYFLVVCNTDKDTARNSGLAVFIVKAKSRGVKVEKFSTFAGDGQCRVRFRNVRVSRQDVLGRINGGRKVVDLIMQWGAVLKCAEICGACQAVLDMTNNYAKERIQFDKPIGSLMVIQHQLVDMFTDVEGLQYLVYHAAWLLSQGVKADVQVSMAKAKANQVYQKACIDSVKIHGAIGFTMDHDLGCYVRRIKSAEFMLGDTSLHLEKIAAGLGL